jgi:hypothetical protein
VALFWLPKSTRIWVSHRYRAWREVHNARACDVMVLSRAKSGRTWLRAMLSRLYQQHYSLAEAQLIEFDNFHRQNAAIPTIYFTHGHYLRDRFASPGWLGAFAPRKLLFLVRHPCDVAVSQYFQSTRRASQHKVELHGVDLAASMYDSVMDSKMGLPAVIDYLNGWAPHIASYANTQLVRYEDIVRAPSELLESIVKFLGAPFSREEIDEAVEFAAFENLQRLEASNFFKNARLSPRNPDDPESFKVRRGKVAGYLDYFDERQVAAMEDRVRSQLSPVFGYSEPLDGEAASPLRRSSRRSSGATGTASADPVGAR